MEALIIIICILSFSVPVICLMLSIFTDPPKDRYTMFTIVLSVFWGTIMGVISFLEFTNLD